MDKSKHTKLMAFLSSTNVMSMLAPCSIGRFLSTIHGTLQSGVCFPLTTDVFVSPIPEVSADSVLRSTNLIED